MKGISIFEDKDKLINLDTLIDSRGLILANSGAGKSYTARKILEESNGEVMSIVIDFEGEFKTLRENYEFLVIGPDGDIPLSMESAHLLPSKLLELNISTILDVSELKRPERAKYVKKFIEALMEIPRKSGLWKPCFIFIDEIHNLAGQQEKQESTYPIIDLATRGRKRGYCLIGCTQRISKLHKDVVAELNNYFAGRTSLDIDMKRTADILGFSTKEDMLSLRNLSDGEFYNFGPAISNNVKRNKISKSKTTHPRRGQISSKEITPLTDKIKMTLSGLADLPKEANKKIKDADDLRVEIVRLKTELNKAKRDIGSDSREVLKEEISNLKLVEMEYKKQIRELENSYKKKISEVDSFHKKNNIITSNELNSLKQKMNKITQIVTGESNTKIEYPSNNQNEISLEVEIPKIDIHVPKVAVPASTPMFQQRAHQPIISESQDYSEKSDVPKLTLCARKIYSFLYANSERQFSRIQLATITGYSHKSGGFSDAISKLNVMGLIEKSGVMIKLGTLDSSFATENSSGLSIESWVNRLNKCARTVLKLLIDNPYQSFQRQDIAEKTGYSHNSGGFSDAISKLNVLGLIEKQGTLIKINHEVLELL